MKAADKHFKFINSETGNAIHYYSLSSNLGKVEIKIELEKVRELVAIKNQIFMGTVYWEEIKEEEKI